MSIAFDASTYVLTPCMCIPCVGTRTFAAGPIVLSHCARCLMRCSVSSLRSERQVAARVPLHRSNACLRIAEVFVLAVGDGAVNALDDLLSCGCSSLAIGVAVMDLDGDFTVLRCLLGWIRVRGLQRVSCLSICLWACSITLGCDDIFCDTV